MSDAKVHETRHWPAPTRLIGQRVLIHAAKTDEGFRDMEEGGQLADLCARLFPLGFRLPRGAFIGSAILTDSFEMVEPLANAAASLNDLICGNWEVGRFAWRMDDRIAFQNPIPARGHQGWWTAEVDLI